ncbi:MAG: cysteine--tRNA ligase [Chthoniobacterales bacterium]
MPTRFFNSLSRTVEPFTPLDPDGKFVSLYTCGPTVYNHAHIGNFRAYVFEDLLQRHLESRGYDVRRVMNLTDVDDKTIRGSREAGVPLAEFTAPFKRAFFEDLDALRIKRADDFPEATAHVARMIDMISTLIQRDHAYQAEDGSVYFRIASFPPYGQLAHLNLDELRPSGRIANDEYEKESIGDFALWKAWDAEDGDVGWESPWGRGRPGWHIECSAMATGLLGDRIDIHCGGEDNIFPHHEAEIAQTECCTGQPFVGLWLHCRHLMVDGQKMAKSAGNFYTLRDLIERGWTGREVRYVLLAVRYREPLNFTTESLVAARSALRRFDGWSTRLDEATAAASPTADPVLPDPDAFREALDDDLNISAALAVLFTAITETNKRLDADGLSETDLSQLRTWRDQVNTVLQFHADTADVPAEVEDLVAQRAAARAARDFAASDTLRDKIAALGWSVKDTKDGQKLTPAG